MTRCPKELEFGVSVKMLQFLYDLALILGIASVAHKLLTIEFVIFQLSSEVPAATATYSVEESWIKQCGVDELFGGCTVEWLCWRLWLPERV